MNKQLTTQEIDALVSTSAAMTRAEKLLRWAALVRETKHNFLIFHRLEYFTADQLAETSHEYSAFAAAAKDPILKDAGLQGDTAADAMKFFELSQQDLHEFSCDCGGAIDNAAMAARIEAIARGESSGHLSTNEVGYGFARVMFDRLVNFRVS
jgi:hypothetical protein